MRSTRRRPSGRRGAASVEFALVCPVLLLVVLGGIVLGMGVFRHQQLASLAREGARWAAVRGPAYQKERGRPAPTSQDVFDGAIRPRLIGLDPAAVTCTLSTSGGVARVTLSYNWVPETILPPMTLSSSAAAPITY